MKNFRKNDWLAREARRRGVTVRELVQRALMKEDFYDGAATKRNNYAKSLAKKQEGGSVETLNEKVVRLAKQRTDEGNWVTSIPESLIKRDEKGNPLNEGYTCIGGVCSVLQDAGVMEKPIWSNTEFEAKAKELGLSNPVYGLDNLEPGDVVQWRQSKNESGKYYPTHAQIYLGVGPDGQRMFFDNFHKQTMSYPEARVKEALSPEIGERRNKESAQIIKLNPKNIQGLGLTPERREELAQSNSVSETPVTYSRKVNPSSDYSPGKHFGYNNPITKVKNTLVDLMNNKDLDKSLRETLLVDDNRLQQLKPLVYGIIGQESNFDNPESDLARAKYAFENSGITPGIQRLLNQFRETKSEFRPSIGPAQQQLENINKRTAERFGIKKDSDLEELDKAYVAAMQTMNDAERYTTANINKGKRYELKSVDPFVRALYWNNNPYNIVKESASDEFDADQKAYEYAKSKMTDFDYNPNSPDYNQKMQVFNNLKDEWKNNNLLRVDKGSYPWKVLNKANDLIQDYDLEAQATLPTVNIKGKKTNNSFIGPPLKKGGPIVDPMGQWRNPYTETIVPTEDGRITMQGVPYPVLGIDETGMEQIMYPDQEYQFKGRNVYEVPMMQPGGRFIPSPNDKVAMDNTRAVPLTLNHKPTINPFPTQIGPASSQTPAQQQWNRNKKIEMARQAVDGRLDARVDSEGNISVNPNKTRFAEGMQNMGDRMMEADMIAGVGALGYGAARMGLRQAPKLFPKSNITSKVLKRYENPFVDKFGKAKGILVDNQGYVPPTTDPKLAPFVEEVNDITKGYSKILPEGIEEYVPKLNNYPKFKGVLNKPDYIDEEYISDRIKRETDWLRSDEYVRRKNLATRKSPEKIKEESEKIIDKINNTNIEYKGFEDGVAGLYTSGEYPKISIFDPQRLEILDHEIQHAFSETALTGVKDPLIEMITGRGYKNYPKKDLSTGFGKIFDPVFGAWKNDAPEQQVISRRIMDLIEKTQGIKRGEELTLSNIDNFREFLNKKSLPIEHFDIRTMMKGYKDKFGKENYSKELLESLNKSWMLAPAILGAGALQQKQKGGVVAKKLTRDNPYLNYGKVFNLALGELYPRTGHTSSRMMVSENTAPSMSQMGGNPYREMQDGGSLFNLWDTWDREDEEDERMVKETTAPSVEEIEEEEQDLSRKNRLDRRNRIRQRNLAIIMDDDFSETNNTSVPTSAPTGMIPSVQSQPLVAQTSSPYSKSLTGNSIAARHNNPGNLKYADWMKQYGAVPGDPGTDGGRFAKFPNVESALKARQHLLQDRPIYKNKTVNEALKLYSNKGYDGSIYPEIRNKKISELTPQEFAELTKRQIIHEDRNVAKQLGYMKVGGTYDVTPEQLAELRRQGYDFNIKY